MTRPLRVAVVGAGPAGMYAAGHLLEGPGGTYLAGRLQQITDRDIEVDVIDRLATPWGLLRHGVAPDHPEKKLAQTVFRAVARRPGFRYFGNVKVGTDVHPDDLGQWYDAVVYTSGAAEDNHLGVPGENLDGCWSAREFVGWYNGHPDCRTLDIDLGHERAVVVGNGNVAMDMARILCTDSEELARSDIADHALDRLRGSKVREVVVLGRRAHFHGAFNNPELEELGRLRNVDIAVEGAEPFCDLDPALDGIDQAGRRKMATIRQFAERP
ncbi:FAD-dependent oxidoreductase [Streptomyces sp. NPDC047061]|uniref:FAD-dependent oxidoreductase n=1 Tax=Streptomyces sp. NPDC047061 TaxID=3154605 RepID=UPI00340222D5